MSRHPADHSPRHGAWLAFVLSVLLHAALLFFTPRPPEPPPSTPGRLSARLAARPTPQAPQPQPQPQVQAPPPPPPVAQAPARVEPPPKRRVITRQRAAPTGGRVTQEPEKPPRFTEAQKKEMGEFLESLEEEKRSGPSLAERALADARNIAREPARGDAEETTHGPITVERIPGTPEISPFSLEMYLDGLVNKLNRNADFAKRTGGMGMRKAAAQLRLNPDGSINSFEVLDMADQQHEMAYIDKLVHRNAPYSPFPPDIVASAKSMSILICVIPAGDGGVGFTRKRGGRGC